MAINTDLKMRIAYLLLSLMAALLFLSCDSTGQTGADGDEDNDVTDGDYEIIDGDNDTGQCDIDADCPQDMLCNLGACIATDLSPCYSSGDCLLDTDCDAGWICNDSCNCENLGSDGDADIDLDIFDPCGKGPRISAETRLEFGSVQYDTTASQTLHITNLCDDQPLTITSVEVVGSDSEFTVENPLTEAVVLSRISDFLEIDVNYHPLDIGLDEDEILISSDDPDGGFRVALISSYKGFPAIEVEPDPLNFHEVVVDEGAANRTLIVRNRRGGEQDNAVLRVNAVRLESNSNGVFSIINNPAPFYLGQGQEREIGVVCDPSGPGSFADKIIFESNDPAVAEHAVDVFCEGVQPSLGVETLGEGNLLNFGTQWVDVPTTVILSLSNTGGGILTVEPPVFGLESDPSFTMDNTNFLGGTLSLSANQSVELPVTYHALAEGTHSGQIHITNNGVGTELFIINLAGRAVPASILADPNPVDFGSVRVGVSFDKVLTLTNDGEVGITLESIGFGSATDVISFGVDDILENVPLLPGEFHELHLSFAPTARGNFNNSVHFTTNDAVMSEMDVPINAQGIAPVIEMRETDNPDFVDQLNFGQVSINSRVERTLEIHNVGDSLLNVESIELTTNSVSQEYSYVDLGEVEIPAGISVTFTVAYEPVLVPGEDFGTLTITCDDPESSVETIYLLGVATDQRLSVSPDSPLEFDPVYYDDQKTERIRLRNRAFLGVLEVIDIEVISGGEVFSINRDELELPFILYENENNSLPVDVTFLPIKPVRGQTDFYGEIRIISDSYVGSEFIYELEGSGKDCEAGCWNLDEDPSVCEYCNCYLNVETGGEEICNGEDDDCNGTPDDGETVTSNCTPPEHSTPQCVNGDCEFECNDDFHDCDELCVFDWDVDHCGELCQACEEPENATAECVDQEGLPVCVFECNENYLLDQGLCKLVGSTDCCGVACINCGEDPNNGSWACLDDECVLYCDNGYHPCDGLCLSNDSILHCGSECEPCPEPASDGQAICNGLVCSVNCNTGHYLEEGECPKCDLPRHCGLNCLDCGIDPDFGSWSCTEEGICLLSCEGETHDCEGDCADNGSVDTCGDRCEPCPIPDANGYSTCEEGVCGVECETGYYISGSNCLPCNNVDHCGSTCNSCGANPPQGAWACDGGVLCKLYCNSGFHDCNDLCVDNNSVNHCGTISCEACAAPTSGGQSTCDGVRCDIDCEVGHYLDGTECPACDTPGHCGLLCLDCGDDPEFGAWTCNGQGECELDCQSGTHACDGECLDDSSVASCGSNCNACTEPNSHGHATCDQGQCGTVCDEGFYQVGSNCELCDTPSSCGQYCINCGSNPANGVWACENPGPGFACKLYCESGYHACGNACKLNNSTDACGESCTSCPEPPGNGHAVCDGVDCGIDCDDGYFQDGLSCDVCNTPSHCGTTCADCGGLDNGKYLCLGGICNPTCDPGYHVCNGQCLSNNHPDHCGASCNTCEEDFGSLPGGYWDCPSGSCVAGCDQGFHLCEGSCVSSSDPDHCGYGCDPCPAPASGNGTASCDGTNCGISCYPHYVLTDGDCVPENSADCCGASCTTCPDGLHSDGVCVDNGGTWGCEKECISPWRDLDGDGNCECQYLGAYDEPDPDFTDSNCDGIDGNLDRAYYVDVDGNDLWAGNYDYPYATVQHGIDQAYAYIQAHPGEKWHVYVSDGVYNQKITLKNGASVWGKYSVDDAWARHDDNDAVIYGTGLSSNRIMAVSGSGISSSTIFADMVVWTRDAYSTEYGASNYAMYCSGCTALEIYGNEIISGDAGPGINGSGGANSACTAVDGTNGYPGSCDSDGNRNGGPGGYGCGGRYGGNGGKGGVDKNAGASGIAGTINGGGGGSAGTGGGASECDGKDGGNGGNGSAGSAGTNGSAGINWTHSSGYYVGYNGGNGVNGYNGHGGGGGGGGGGQGGFFCDDGGGNGGGGGGGGGGYGYKANGGTAGGGSFGLFLSNSSGVSVHDNVIGTGNGGKGGNGGTGGGASSGGGRGYGATSCTSEVGAGGNGGLGGAGGRGGHGGGAAGGACYGVYRANTTVYNLDADNNISHGTAGARGTSSGNNGSTGSSGNVY